MLVKLKRDFNGPGGVFYAVRNGLAEFPDDYDLGEQMKNDDGTVSYANLPSDAQIVSKNGTLPSSAIPAKPGFQAKPENEQQLDLIPGAGLIDDAAMHTDNVELSDDDKKRAEENAKRLIDANEKAGNDQTVSQKVTADLVQTKPGNASAQTKK